MALISRDDIGALGREEVAPAIRAALDDTFWLFNRARRLPDMASKQTRMPVWQTLPKAYFVDGDTGQKKTTNVSWANKYIDAEELACIVPIPEAVLDDMKYDLESEVIPGIAQAFSEVITGAVLYGTNIPATWTTNLGAAGLVALATARTSVASLAGFKDFYEAVEGESADGAADGVLALLENDGFQATGHVGHVKVKTMMRNCRDTNGQKIYPGTGEIDGAPVVYPQDGMVDADEALMISGDWNQLVYSIRQDMTFKIADEASLYDAQGNLLYALFQQDMIAIRAVMRLGFAAPNPPNLMEPTEASRCPWAILTV